MDKLEKRTGCKQQESATDLFLKWGNKKRLRCVRVRDADDAADPSYAVSGSLRIRRKIHTRFVDFPSDNNYKEPSLPPPSTRLTRNSETAATLRSEANRKPSPEKPAAPPPSGDEKVKHVWPKLYIALTSKEKEEDFMAMKGCKPPHRPKKRAKMIQRSLLLVSPGAWLTDLCQDRYEVVEKKSTKKRPTGLKAMGSMESDSEG